jgi:hypothetical protein
MSRPFCICIDVTFFATQLHSTYYKLHCNKKGRERRGTEKLIDFMYCSFAIGAKLN